MASSLLTSLFSCKLCVIKNYNIFIKSIFYKEIQQSPESLISKFTRLTKNANIHKKNKKVAKLTLSPQFLHINSIFSKKRENVKKKL